MKGAHDLDLMAHADGELDQASGHDIEEQLGRDSEARAKVDGVGEVGELIRGHLELSADKVADKRFAALWREIDKGIDHNVLRADHERASMEDGRVAASASSSIWRRIGRFFDHHRGHVITGAVSAGAVAALALVLRSGEQGAHTADHGAIQASPAAFRPTEIESIDTPGGNGTVFNLKDEEGSTTVIWVTPEDTVEGI